MTDNGQHSARLKSEIWDSIWISHLAEGVTKLGTSFIVFPSALAVSWIGKRAAWTKSDSLILDVRVAGDNLICCAITLVPKINYLKRMLINETGSGIYENSPCNVSINKKFF